MLFNSWGYLLFMLLLVPAQRLVPERARVPLLAAGSLGFYAMWRWEFCSLLILSSAIDYLCASKIHASEDDSARKRWLALSLTLNLGLLVVFKYTYFLYDNVSAVAGLAGATLPDAHDLGLNIVLPLGISFYTFQTISYTIDIYRRVAEPTPTFAGFLAYVSYWPQLIAGPILRAGEVLPQLLKRQPFRWSDVGVGTELVLRGLFKKVVIADRIAPLVDAAFALDASRMNAIDVWVATFLFGFQIYLDFAGYSDIAIGSARIMGLRFPDNFNWPYLSRSPREFWKRWHISLSSWIRDYLYLPLSGAQFRTQSRGGLEIEEPKAAKNSPNRALFLTWFIMGLWHGAGWNFAIWGVYHAVIIYAYRRLKWLEQLTQRFPLLGWATVLMASMAAWIPFRAVSVKQTVTMFGKLINPMAYTLSGRTVAGHAYLAVAVLMVAMLAAAAIDRKLPVWTQKPLARTVAVATSSALVTVSVLIWLKTVRQFIYFQF
ncbi:MAG: hypothetical protein RIT45_3391 [Pseudomonadota bacterium]|jgi:D-alanyl-lipoteichoic acid acyltransferase DltB (MBOAT superfamily)